MLDFLHTVTKFFAPKPVRIIEAVNDCGERRYIEMAHETNFERRESLEILLTKCRKLLSFVMTKSVYIDDAKHIIKLSEKIRQSIYRNDDTMNLFTEYEQYESKYKRTSKSIMNLSALELG